MGQTESAMLTPTQLEEYQDCTFFTKKETLHIHKRFCQLNVKNSSELTITQVLTLPELEVNPFGPRICEVFCDKQTRLISFEDFLDCMSVFSEGATRDVKASYAFRIYDFDSDGYLGKSDLVETVKCLCGTTDLSAAEIELVADKILQEADLDGDHKLSYVEFEHVISRAPDFINTFRIRI